MRKTASDPESTRAGAELRRIRREIEEAEQEVARLETERRNFEGRVEKRIGHLADQLASLEAEIRGLELAVEQKRNETLFGKKHGFQDPNYWRNWADSESDDRDAPPDRLEAAEPKIRELYRQLARKYHPDLALDDSDLAFRTEMMTAVNRAFTAGSLAELKALALGVKLPDDIHKSLAAIRPTAQDPAERELAEARRRLRDLRDKIQRHHQHPSVLLSLNVALARAEGQDLLAEMARDLRKKIAHKAVQRDFLRSQLDASD